MTHDQFEDQDLTTADRAMGRPRGRFVVAGVIGACALGVGLGLWARPSAGERFGEPASEFEAEIGVAAGRRLQIVVDDTLPPVGAPLEVMPANLAAAARPAPAPTRLPAAPQPVIPLKPPPALMKVDAPVAPRQTAPPQADRPPKAEARPKPKPKATSAPKREPAKAKAKTPSEAKAPGRGRDAKVAARSAKAGGTPAKAKAVKAAAKPAKAHARAEPRKASKAQVQTAQAPPKPKSRPAPAKKAAARPKPPAPHGEGPMRVARAQPCALADPAEALVCADPRLNQRDRQLQRAYREAEAAGVPASALTRQQDRWRAARTAAARDGSWAVEDVYVARIAELKDLARDARDY